MRIDAATYRRMPPQLQRLFRQLPNPGSDEVVGLFPERKAGVAIRRHGNQGCGTFPVKIAPGSSDVGYGDNGSVARFFYTAKASRRERNAGLEALPSLHKASINKMQGAEVYRTRCTVCGASLPNATTEHCGAVTERRKETGRVMQNLHPTVKPLALMEYLCKLTMTPTGGVVLDPFMGSGTTGIACVNIGRDFIGIEIDEGYLEIAQQRIGAAEAEMASRLL